VAIQLKVNGKTRAVTAEPDTPLLYVASLLAGAPVPLCRVNVFNAEFRATSRVPGRIRV
jgi:hypothetical protein